MPHLPDRLSHQVGLFESCIMVIQPMEPAALLRGKER
jgi:hypothetical protein